MTRLSIITLLTLVAICSLSVQAADTRGDFKNWIGHSQYHWIVGSSGWHNCWSNTTGGSCGSRSLTTGSSKCKSRGVDVGVSFDLKKWIPGLSISSGGNWSWSSCNTRSETITCSPNQGYAGRAEIIFAERYGKTDFTGYNKYFSNRNNGCKRGFSFQSSDGFYGWCVPSTFSSNGYWPEKRYSQCTYRKL